MTHKQIYMKAFNIGPEDVVLCEVCGAVAVDVHHVLFKSQQGKDEIHNLILLCRYHHDMAHGKITNKELTRSRLYDIINERDS
jgi:hypothetical protein